MHPLIFIVVILHLTGCTSLLFQPVKKHADLPVQVLNNVEDFTFKSIDGTNLHGWYLPSRSNPKKPKHTVLYLHGNAINISSHLGGVYWLPEHDVEAYIFDYRGYGKSEGIAFLQGVLADIDAALTFVAERTPAERKVWVIGHSVGASMGIYSLSQFKAKDRLSGFISVSAFSDYHEITQEFLSRNWLTWSFQWPLSYTINNEFSPKEYINEINPLPIYLIHGNQDNIISPRHSKVLYEKASNPKSLHLVDAKHNDIFVHSNVKNYVLNILNGNNAALSD